MSIKVVKLECLAEQTLVKDSTGKKIRVKKGDQFETDPRTAETYLNVYRKHFALVSNGAEGDNAESNLELENKVTELQEKLDEANETIESQKAEIVEVQLEALRSKHEGVELKDIPYADLRKIATLKGLEFDKTPKGEDLIKALEDQAKTEAEGAEK